MFSGNSRARLGKLAPPLEKHLFVLPRPRISAAARADGRCSRRRRRHLRRHRRCRCGTCRTPPGAWPAGLRSPLRRQFRTRCRIRRPCRRPCHHRCHRRHSPGRAAGTAARTVAPAAACASHAAGRRRRVSRRHHRLRRRTRAAPAATGWRRAAASGGGGRRTGPGWPPPEVPATSQPSGERGRCYRREKRRSSPVSPWHTSFLHTHRRKIGPSCGTASELQFELRNTVPLCVPLT